MVSEGQWIAIPKGIGICHILYHSGSKIYCIRRRELSLVKDGLFFAIYRNWRFKPSMMFVVYMIFRFSSGYSKKVLKTPQFGGIEYLASQRIMTHWHAGCQNWDLVLSQLELMFPQRVAG